MKRKGQSLDQQMPNMWRLTRTTSEIKKCFYMGQAPFNEVRSARACYQIGRSL